jgi:predicted LPLAT superfamily acyltransferase
MRAMALCYRVLGRRASRLLLFPDRMVMWSSGFDPFLVGRLEAACLRFPNQWFNFYDVWNRSAPP